MRSSCVFLLLVIFAGSAGVAPNAQSPTIGPRVRALDPWAAETLVRGTSRSALVGMLVETLEASDLIVHIATEPFLADGLGGTTRFVARVGDYRYVRISIDRDLMPDYRVAVLGHELQHAREIATSNAGDHEAIRRLYLSIGHAVGRTNKLFDTPEAEAVGQRVWAELKGRAGW